MTEPRPPPLEHTLQQPQQMQHLQQGGEGLTCQWNNCLRVFPNHPSLASHLSEDHVGWKKGGYYCDWSHCPRQGTKCHNRFALMMHLRIHTGEKPFECTVPNCGQTFGRMDALVRHKKAEHGESSVTETDSNMTNPIMQTPIPSLTHHTSTAATKPTNKRQSSKKTAAPNSQESPKPTNYKRPKLNHQLNRTKSEGVDDVSLSSTIEKDNTKSRLAIGSPDYIQYRLAKAQLAYILRENEMLQDEYESTQTKLKRMRTERRVLLDALMRRHSSSSGLQQEEVEEEVEVEEGEQEEYIIPDNNHINNHPVA